MDYFVKRSLLGFFCQLCQILYFVIYVILYAPVENLLTSLENGSTMRKRVWITCL